MTQITSNQVLGVSEESLKLLAEPFPVKWKPNNFFSNKTKVLCVAYIDARDVQRRLDKVCGISNWKSRILELKGNIYCEISIKVNGEWISRTDVGKQSKVEPEKGEASDALKRAAVHWGIGRFLYDLPMQTLFAKSNGNKTYAADGNGKIFYDNTALSKYINKKNKSLNRTPTQQSGNCKDLLKEYGSVVLDLIPKITNTKELKALWAKIPSLKEDIDIINEMNIHGTGLKKKESK